MIIDPYGTEFRGGRLILPKDKPRGIQWWQQDIQDGKTHYQIAAKAGDLIVWQGNFTDLIKALSFWRSLHELGPAPHEWDFPTPSWHPGLSEGLTYEFSTITTFLTTPGGGTWSVPSDVISVDYLVVAGGGGGAGTGGSIGGGGGGAGGMKTGSAFPVPSSTAVTLTVGTGGNGGASVSPFDGANGNDSVFHTVTSTGGGGGRNSVAGGNGGSGGGGSFFTANGTGIVGQGHDGGNGLSQRGGSGGGGAAAVGQNGTGSGANGGNGSSSSISGSPVTYAGGGGGGGGLATAGGVGGVGGGGNGGNDAVGGNGTPNFGGGGGGAGQNIAGTSLHVGGNGGAGIVILLYDILITGTYAIPSFIRMPNKRRVAGY